MRSDQDINTILEADPAQMSETPADYASEQRKDQQLKEIIGFLSDGQLPEDSNSAKVIASQEALFMLVDRVLYYVDSKNNNRRRVVVDRRSQYYGLTLYREWQQACSRLSGHVY